MMIIQEEFEPLPHLYLQLHQLRQIPRSCRFKNSPHNVLWVWNPNEKSFPNFTWNAMELYYPGNEYVDIIGLTGYNTGVTNSFLRRVCLFCFCLQCSCLCFPALLKALQCLRCFIHPIRTGWIDSLFRSPVLSSIL